MPDNLWQNPKTKLWYLRIQADGKRRTFPTGTRSKMEARRIAEAKKTDIRRGKVGFEKEEKRVTLDELCERYLEWSAVNHRSFGSDKAYCHNLIEFFGRDVHIQAISEWDIEKFKSMRAKQVKPATVNHDLKCLKHMFRLASEEWKLTKENPARKTKKLTENNQRLRFLSDDERQRLLAACAAGPWYLLPIVQVAVNAGLRRGEILNLEWKDVSTENGIIRVAKSKSGRPREIPMNQILIDLFKSIEQSESRIFPVDGFRRSWETAKQQAGITDLRFHDLRHEFASQLIMTAGADLRTVQELLGHSSPVVTMRYAHLSEQHKRDAVERLVGLQRKPAAESDEAGKVVKIY